MNHPQELFADVLQQSDSPASGNFHDSRCIHLIIEDWARETPDAPAVVFEGETLTYRELDRRANGIACRLRHIGLAPDAIVGLCVPRSLDMVVGLLGIWKAGAAYLPLDPDYPADRLAYMLEHSRAAALITRTSLLLPNPDASTGVVLLDREELGEMDAVQDTPAAAHDTERLAYCIYTSGSSGRPKGVAVSHAALLNHIVWQVNAFAFDRSDVVLQRTSISFDASVWELWTLLALGGKVVVLSSDAQKNPREIAKTIAAHGVSIVQLVPTLLRAVLELDLRDPLGCRHVFCGGEPLTADLLRDSARTFPHGLTNLYGPTETTIDATYWRYLPGSAVPAIVPIGQPIANARAYLLDEQRNPVSPGEKGELYIAGAGLARGYLHSPGLTEERFVANPFDGAGTRMYKTGDLGRLLPDGNIEFLGRIDYQVKIRGFRIELGEIEAALAEYDGVKEAVVIARESRAATLQLVAFVICKDGAQPASAELRAHLNGMLPDYMVPSRYVVMERFPLSPNGKVDRKALSAVVATLAIEHLDARTADESALVEIWKTVLKLERIGVQDDFLELGGHSLLALQVISRIQTQFARVLELKAFFKHPSIEQCAELLPQLPHCDDTDARQPNFDVSAETLTAYNGVPTGNQISMLALPSHAPAYVDNICLALEFAGPFDRDALHTAFAVVTDRHESLRTSFKVNLLGKLRAVVAPSVDAFQRFADLSALPETEAKTQLIEQIKADNKVPFDIARGSLIRFALYKLSESRHVCAIFIHHAITDGWSLNVLLSDLGEAYTASVELRSATFTPLESQYSDFAAWQNAGLDSGALDAQRRFWEQEMHALPPALRIGCAERPEHFTFDGQKVGFDLQHETVAIDGYCKEHGMSSYAFLLSAYFLTLFKYTAERDVYILCPVANRKSSQFEQAIGYFANAVIARQSFDPSATLADFAQRVADKSLEALSNQDFPLATLEDKLCTKHGSEYGARFQLRFNHQNFPGQTPVFGPLTTTPVAVPVKGIRTDLILKTWREGGSFNGSFVYYDKIFARADIEQLVSEYRSTIALAIASPTLPCGELIK